MRVSAGRARPILRHVIGLAALLAVTGCGAASTDRHSVGLSAADQKACAQIEALAPPAAAAPTVSDYTPWHASFNLASLAADDADLRKAGSDFLHLAAGAPDTPVSPAAAAAIRSSALRACQR